MRREWKRTIHLKHLFTKESDLKSIQDSMSAIADEIKKRLPKEFADFDLTKFKSIPEGDSVVTPEIYANILITRLYDYADDNRIQID